MAKAPKPFEPMLAATWKEGIPVKFPVYASPKIDGVRVVVRRGPGGGMLPYGRSLKIHRNEHFRAMVDAVGEILEGSDGEVVVTEPTHPRACALASGAMNSIDQDHPFRFYIFDVYSATDTFVDRHQSLVYYLRHANLPDWVHFVPQVMLYNMEELLSYEVECTGQGYEGIMLRDPEGLYKHGRSTVKEGGLLKVKRFKDFEAEVIGVDELCRNDNAATTNELGRTSRSGHQANLTPMGTAGTIRCRGIAGQPFAGVEFGVGTGLTHAQRAEIWAMHLAGTLAGRLATLKYLNVGVKDKPRIPVFKAFREGADVPKGLGF